MIKVLLTGATGFLGRHSYDALGKAYGPENIVGVSSKDYDLMEYAQAERVLKEVRPDVVVHLAAYSGGIGANRAYPADFYFRNTIMTANMFEAAARIGVQKLVYTMGGCSYPAKAVSPISEDQLWNGYPQDESAGYSTAKMMGTVASRSYRTQYGLNSIVLIPGNLYGEFDNFSTLDSHVVPAMIRRYYEAQEAGHSEVVMWGSGKPQRDFVYAADVAKLIPWFIENYDSSDPVNISAGKTTEIRELAETIARHVGFTGEIKWDSEKPDGQMIKIFSTERLKSLGQSCDTPLDDGLNRTIAWFAKNYANRSDGLRL
jgi:GDP-L-fucose synthase